MKKATLNYWVDLAIGASFAVSAVSGLVFLVPTAADTILGIGLGAWSLVHTWASVVMIAGVVAHLVLHRAWIARMTEQELTMRAEGTELSPGRRRFLRTAGLLVLAAAVPAVLARTLTGTSEQVQAAAAADGQATAETGATGSGAGNSAAAGPTVASAASDTPATASPTTGAAPATAVPSVAATTAPGRVACPKGIRYDPFPGRCPLYRDRDGDRYCDLSVPSA